MDTLLDVGKIAAGHWHLKPRPVAIETLVEEVIELLAPRAQAKGLELAAHVSLHVPDIVSVDPDQLSRILTNLIGNAIKFTEHGGVAIEVTAEPLMDASVTLEMRVRDSGVGITVDDQLRIFGEYQQAGDIVSRGVGGTGLGLAISRTIARMMGGDITLESTPAKGSVFYLRVDLPVLESLKHRERLLNGKHILLVSDRVIEPPLLMRRLFDLGASVELARDIPSAGAILATGRSIDVILLDHGQALDAASFRSHVVGKVPPIAVMLAPADRDALPGIRASGVEAHLVKPIRSGSLTKVISAMLSGDVIANLSPEAVPAAEAIQQIKPLRILLADDNEINVLLGKSVLQSLGQSVETVGDGALAVSRAKEAFRLGQPFDVILMDLHMPVLDGFAAIAAIRAATQAAERKPFIVALTADTTEESSIRAIEFGADITLTKPFQQSTLAEILERRQSPTVIDERERSQTSEAC